MNKLACPCAYFHEKARRVVAPAVDCDGKCKSCGWNPLEQKRRVSYGFTDTPWGGKKIIFEEAE